MHFISHSNEFELMIQNSKVKTGCYSHISQFKWRIWSKNLQVPNLEKRYHGIQKLLNFMIDIAI
jgi:hypothetical protein